MQVCILRYSDPSIDLIDNRLRNVAEEVEFDVREPETSTVPSMRRVPLFTRSPEMSYGTPPSERVRVAP